MWMLDKRDGNLCVCTVHEVLPELIHVLDASRSVELIEHVLVSYSASLASVTSRTAGNDFREEKNKACVHGLVGWEALREHCACAFRLSRDL